MQYFILMPNDSESELSDANLLGESSFGTFWSGGGLSVLMKIVDRQPELIEHIIIKTDTNKILTIDQFLTDLQKLKVQ